MSTSTVHRQAESARQRARRARRSPATPVADTTLDLLSITDPDALTPSPIDAARITAANAAIQAGAGRSEYDALADAAIHLPPRDEEGNQ